MTYEEYLQWIKYRNKRGSLNNGLRVERAGAILAQMMANRYRKDGSPPFSFYDFAPHYDEPTLTIDNLKGWK